MTTDHYKLTDDDKRMLGEMTTMDEDKCCRCGRYATLNEPRGWSAKRNAPAYAPVCHRCYDDFTAPMDDVLPRYTEAEHLAAVAELRAEGLPRLDVYSEEEWPKSA